MIPRRDFLQVGMAASAILGASGFGTWSRVAAQQRLTQDQLLEFDTFGNVSLIHITDIHGQLKPIYFREPSINIGVGSNKGAVPHVTGADFRKLYGISDGSRSHYALSSGDFSALADSYGRVGGLDRDFARRWRHMAWVLHLLEDRSTRHGQCHECAFARRHDFSLGIYAWQ